MKLPNVTRPLYGVGEQNTKMIFFLSKLRYDPFGFNPPKFRQHLTYKMKLNRIDEFETVRIHLVCCYQEMLLSWQYDLTTSPL